MKNISKTDKYKLLDSTSTREHKTELNYTLVNQAINIRKSYKRVTKEIERISNATIKDSKREKKIQLNYNKNHYAERNKQYKDNIINDKNQLSDNKHNVGQLSRPVLDLLKVFYNTRSDNKILEHSTHTLKITKGNNSNINTIKQSTKYKQQTSNLHTKRVNEKIQPTTDEYTIFILVTENQMNLKLNNKEEINRVIK